MSERLILMATIGKPHGVRGLVRVNAYTEDAHTLPEYPLTDRQGRRFSLQWIRENIAQLCELSQSGHRAISTRTEAERLTNLELFAPRSALPEPDEDVFYLADLIGLPAKDNAGQTLGTITAIHDYGGGTSLEIFCAGAAPLLLPFTKDAVPVIDLTIGLVVVNPPAETTAMP